MSTIRLRSSNKPINIAEYPHGHIEQIHANLDAIHAEQMQADLEEVEALKAMKGNERFMRFTSSPRVAPLLMFAAALLIGFGLFHDGSH